ncbi:muramoyltetrapeptide carboxypeptidase LdcA involved in peptidoglycan recycling [Lysinibacillus composti]|uniref:LD-carboxypeptidase n=1 Tax=Lysinibacillus composti TaxID=720633 RepID=A0A3N9U727_9BACI|nr:S66 peptidase family protein [Lysinibacillus composti]MBM7610383.1 muramoyltetrapeptide carboxypeptidase LdcA involved in peptidoglycan recycling [Lysinibacillus composti]RQW72345.1 LD-carboxypeptidase [Lysinibacillus composti]
MITYPTLIKKRKVAVTAPSAGVERELHHLLHKAVERLQSKGYEVMIGETCWTQYKAKSAQASVRAEELNSLLQDDTVNLIFPPWGGELLIEILEFIDFEKVIPKWILGYSDISVLLLALTLKTGIATAHGTNLIDLRGKFSDPTTAMWENVLFTKSGQEVKQYSSERYQQIWNHHQEIDIVFYLTEQTNWKTIYNNPFLIKGRLLGGCIDVIRHLIGTPYGNVTYFQQQFIENEPIIWYLENCQMTVVDLRRSLMQMKYAGWFDNCHGILFGRSEANQPVNDYNVVDVYMELAEELNLPIAYDIDCGHMPPQITFVNGAYAEVEVSNGKGKVTQRFI